MNERNKPVKWEYAFNSGDDIFENNEFACSLLNTEVFSKESSNNAFIFKFYDGQAYSTIYHEIFNADELNNKYVSPEKESIGFCLQQWNMGCRETLFEINGKKTFIGVTINTKKHMYIFEITPNSIYCRAARYYTCDKGVVFNQNFRQGFEAYMIEDNKIAMDDLIIDEALFNPNACVWNNCSVYWSVISVEDKVITLNGCQGEIYKWESPI